MWVLGKRLRLAPPRNTKCDLSRTNLQVLRARHLRNARAALTGRTTPRDLFRRPHGQDLGREPRELRHDLPRLAGIANITTGTPIPNYHHRYTITTTANASA